ncbi:MAG: beta-galactosidase [Treponema sp.]|nr:beta-galactosidase [Treponema sp.]
MYSFDNISLKQDSKRWFPVMGEIHYSRFPKAYWKESLLKMKAGGIDVASTYVIWIHHEEIEGEYDFTGDRDLRLFVSCCKECKIKLWLRIGPWIHGEVRNGGFPDWLLHKDFQVRTNDERYFSLVEKWYKKIYEEVKDYFYSEKDSDNPIIGIQIENEFGHCGGLYDESGELHMQRLTKMAKEIGFNAVFYTATGWGGARTGGLIPVMGGYCDAPWDPRTTEIEPSGNYIFTYERNDHNIGSDYGLGEGITFDVSKFPYLTAELGGGLQMTKHRRTVASAKDIGAVSLVKIGSGVNLLGYYMYHGGTNPDGKLTSLQESKASGYPNDLPEKSYDFNAPIREYGQIAPVYKELKLLFYFVKDFGSELCDLPALIPEENPLKPDNLRDLRYAYRTDGKKGYLFINNYVRLKKMPEHKNVQLPLPDKTALFPKIDILSGEYFFFPFNMDFSGKKVLWAFCSPFCKLNEENFVFYAVENSDRKNSFFNFEEPASDVKFLVLNRKDALNSWKFKIKSKEYLFISENSFIQEPNGNIIFSGRGKKEFMTYPELEKLPQGFEEIGKKNLNMAEDLPAYNFTIYRAAQETEKELPVKNQADLIIVKEVSSSKEKKIYNLNLKELVKSFKSEKEGAKLNDIFVKLSYEGESARLSALINGKKKLIADNFFSGKDNPWEIGLKRYINSDIDFENLELEIYALTSCAQIYFEKDIIFKNDTLCNFNKASFEFEWSYKLNIN